MNEDDLRQLDEILGLPEDHPRRREALTSPRMRNLLREYEEFMGEAPVAAVPVLPDLPVHRRSRFAPRSRWRRARTALVVAASLAVIGIGLRTTLAPDQEPRYRSGDAIHALGLEITRLDDTTVELHWEAVEGATEYRLVVFGTDLTERGLVPIPTEPPLSVDLRRFGVLEELAVRLIVLGPDGELTRSPLRPVPAR